MAGSNKILKPNEMLFSIGDPADVMYIIRKGNLKVFFPKGKEEVTLASIKDGAIVGEMAFFDDKPRSASVRAMDTCEVTIITKSDFEKLLQQVPKWMVTMMQSLVGRLRQTNEKVQALEASQGGKAPQAGGSVQSSALMLPNQQHPFQHALRAMQLLMLSWARDGEKDNREITLQKEHPVKLWADFSAEDPVIFENTLKVLEKCKFIALRLDARKIPIIVFLNRGQLANFTEFFAKVAKQLKPLNPFFSTAAIDLFTALVDQVVTSGYETLNVGLKSLIATYAAKGQDVSAWGKAATELTVLPDFKVQKNSDDIGIKIVLKEHKLMLVYVHHMQAFKEAKLV